MCRKLHEKTAVILSTLQHQQHSNELREVSYAASAGLTLEQQLQSQLLSTRPIQLPVPDLDLVRLYAMLKLER